jgi:hypothetical protein
MCQISFSDIKYFFTRGYLIFPYVEANVSVLMKLSLLFISLFYSIFNKFRLDWYICNRLIFIEYQDGIDLKGKYINYSDKEIFIILQDIKKYLELQIDKNYNNNDIIIENINNNQFKQQLKKSNKMKIKNEQNSIHNNYSYFNMNNNYNNIS